MMFFDYYYTCPYCGLPIRPLAMSYEWCRCDEEYV